MKNAEIFTKSIALMLVAGCVGVACLRETLEDMKIERQTSLILDKTEKIAEREPDVAQKMMFDKCQKAAIAGANGNIPFLCKGIKYDNLIDGETVVFYNSNQYLEYNAIQGVCIKYIYKCPIGKKVYTGDELLEKAEYDVIQAFVSRTDTKIVNTEIVHENEKTVTFSVDTSVGENIAILISYRLDTGSCIYFDAAKVAERLK